MDFEVCFLCGDRTGMAGMKEDSIYHDGRGPLCSSCFDKLHGMDRKPMNKIYHAEGRDGNMEEAVVVASDMEAACILMGYGKKWQFTTIGTAREYQPEEVFIRVDNQKT